MSIGPYALGAAAAAVACTVALPLLAFGWPLLPSALLGAVGLGAGLVTVMTGDRPLGAAAAVLGGLGLMVTAGWFAVLLQALSHTR